MKRIGFLILLPTLLFAGGVNNPAGGGGAPSGAAGGDLSGTYPNPTVAKITDTNGNNELALTATGSAVNYLTLANAATSGAPSLTAAGSASNIGITLASKGSGTSGNAVVITSGNGSATEYDFGASALFSVNSNGWLFSMLSSSSVATLSSNGKPIALATGAGYLYLGDSSTGKTFAAKPTAPAQITADQNNYNSGGTSYYQRWSTDASRNITGMTFTATQVDGQTHVITNVGSFNIVLVNESASSTAANRFHNSGGADITLAPDNEVNCWYDNTTARWRVSKRF